MVAESRLQPMFLILARSPRSQFRYVIESRGKLSGFRVYAGSEPALGASDTRHPEGWLAGAALELNIAAPFR